MSSLLSMANQFFPSAVVKAMERCQRSAVGMRFLKGAFWSMGGAVISRGLMMAAWVLVARILGKSGYGEFGVIRSTVDMFTVFAGFGLGLTATKFVAQYRYKDPEKAGRIISMSGIFAALSGGLIAVGLYFFAPWLADHTLNAPHLAPALQIGGLMLLASALNGAQNGALSGFESFRQIAAVNVVCGLISFPLFWVCALKWGLYGILWAYASNLWLIWLLSHVALKQAARSANVPLAWQSCWREWPILCSFSLPAVAGGIMVSPVKWAGNAMLVNQPDGYAHMGLFTAALIFQTSLHFISSTVSRPLLSMLSNLDDKTPESLARLNMLISWSMGILAAVPLLCFPEIAEWLFGRDYSGTAFRHTLALILLYTCIVMYKEGLARVLAANNLMWWGFLSNTVWALVLLTSLYYLLPLGAPGLALSYVSAYVLNTLVIMPLYVRRKLVPQNTLLSLETLSIWGILVGLTASVFFNPGLPLRLCVFVLSTAIILFSLKRIAISSARPS